MFILFRMALFLISILFLDPSKEHAWYDDSFVFPVLERKATGTTEKKVSNKTD